MHLRPRTHFFSPFDTDYACIWSVRGGLAIVGKDGSIAYSFTLTDDHVLCYLGRDGDKFLVEEHVTSFSEDSWTAYEIDPAGAAITEPFTTTALYGDSRNGHYILADTGYQEYGKTFTPIADGIFAWVTEYEVGTSSNGPFFNIGTGQYFDGGHTHSDTKYLFGIYDGQAILGTGLDMHLVPDGRFCAFQYARARLAGDLGEVDWRAHHERVGTGHGLEQRGEPVLDAAPMQALAALALAGKAASAPLEVHLVQVEPLGLGAFRLGALDRLLEQPGGVLPGPRAPVDGYELHSRILSLVRPPHYSAAPTQGQEHGALPSSVDPREALCS